MPDYLFLMHDDVPQSASETSGYDWGSYLGGLRAAARFDTPLGVQSYLARIEISRSKSKP